MIRHIITATGTNATPGNHIIVTGGTHNITLKDASIKLSAEDKCAFEITGGVVYANGSVGGAGRMGSDTGTIIKTRGIIFGGSGSNGWVYGSSVTVATGKALSPHLIPPSPLHPPPV